MAWTGDNAGRAGRLAAWCAAAILCAPAWSWLVRRWLDGQYLAGALAAVLTAVEAVRIIRGHPGVAGPTRGADRFDVWTGPLLVCLGAALAWVANVLESSVLLGWCFPLIAGGLYLQTPGATRDRRLVPLFFFSLLAFPLPGLVSAQLSLPMRLAAGRIAAFVLNLGGIECVARGVVVETLRYRNTVVPACGGEEVIHLFLVVGAALAYLQQDRTLNLRFWIQVFGTAPAALAANGVRIALLTFVGHRWGAAAAAGFFHDFSGLLVFAVFLVLMILAGEALRRGRRAFPAGGAAPAPGGDAGGVRRSAGPGGPAAGDRRRFGVVLSGLQLLALAAAGGMSLYCGFSARNAVWGRNLSRLVPNDLPGWRWESLLLTLSEESYLSRNVVIKRRYHRGDTEVVLFAVTGAGGRRQAYHSPEVCYRGDGWQILTSRAGARIEPDRPGGRPIPYHVLTARRGATLATTLFWLDNGTVRTARPASKSWDEIKIRLAHPFRRRDRWALITITSLDSDPGQALADCLALARALP